MRTIDHVGLDVPDGRLGQCEAAFLAIRRHFAEALAEELPVLLARLEQEHLHGMKRFMAISALGEKSVERRTAEPERWIKASEAAAIADVPVKRIYEWARGKKWASRPTRRCLRIEEVGFRAWIRAKRST